MENCRKRNAHKQFVLKPDSQILSRINVDHKVKVKRWTIAIQHYEFKVQHIKEKENVVADALSRLVPLREHNAEVHFLV